MVIRINVKNQIGWCGEGTKLFNNSAGCGKVTDSGKINFKERFKEVMSEFKFN